MMTDFLNNEIVYFDSCPKHEYDWKVHPAHRLLQFLKDHAYDINFKHFHPKIWKVFSAHNSDRYKISSQGDNVSCAIYTILSSDFLSIHCNDYHDGIFDLSEVINDTKIAERNSRAIIMALIVQFDSTMFEAELNNYFSNRAT